MWKVVAAVLALVFSQIDPSLAQSPAPHGGGKVCPGSMTPQAAAAAGCRFIGSETGYDICANIGMQHLPQCAEVNYPQSGGGVPSHQVYVGVIMPTQHCERANASRPANWQYDCSTWCRNFLRANSTAVSQPQLPAICAKYGLGRGQGNEGESCPDLTDQILQSLLDFDRGFFDFASIGVTRGLREAILQEDGEIVDQQVYDVGTWSGAVASVVVPVPAPGKVKVFINIAEWARESEITADAARWLIANSKLVWEAHPFIRGVVIEKVLAITAYRNYRWVGPLNKGKFRLIDFIDEAGKKAVSLKTVQRSTAEGWQAAQRTLQKHIDSLGNVNKQWVSVFTKQELEQGMKAACAKGAASTWHYALDVRVPRGAEHYLQDLIAYGKQAGVEVRVLPWP
jgi:hypothetical protein